jgi:hypothetical protein
MTKCTGLEVQAHLPHASNPYIDRYVAICGGKKIKTQVIDDIHANHLYLLRMFICCRQFHNFEDSCPLIAYKFSQLQSILHHMLDFLV